MLKGIITAFKTLTLLPVPGKDSERMSDALPWFPLVGFILGAILYGIVYVFKLMSGDWNAGAAGIAIIGSVILTRGLHLDGLADWADGFGGGRNMSHTLAIMKDSHTGVFGVLTIILVLLIKYVSLLRLIHMGFIHLLVPVYIISRTVMVPLAVFLPYARTEGGTANPFVHSARLYHFFGALIISLVLLYAFNGLLGWVPLLFGLFITFLLGCWFYHRIKGITGDLLGACCEIVEAGLFLFFAILGNLLFQYLSGKAFPI